MGPYFTPEPKPSGPNNGSLVMVVEIEGNKWVKDAFRGYTY